MSPHVKEKQKAKVIETARKAEEKVAKEAEKAIARKKREEEKAAKGLGKAKVKAQENGVKDDAIEVSTEEAKEEPMDDQADAGVHCEAMVVQSRCVPPHTLVLCEFARHPFMSRAAVHTLGTSPCRWRGTSM